jgi:hypothetical protein
MFISKPGKNLLMSILRRYNYSAVPNDILYDWQRESISNTRCRYNESKLPEEVELYLEQKKDRLKELEARYAVCDRNVIDQRVWVENHINTIEFRYFRGDNPYVWQLRGENTNPPGYALTLYYVKSIDSHALLDKLTEDDSFGIFTFLVDNKIISRDLLDSIIEMYFLDKHLKISSASNLKFLDIGAGYGRLAHRIVVGFPNIRSYYCTDAIAASTFISELYIEYRKIGDKVKVVPLDEIEKLLETEKIDIAVNIHSFSECKPEAVEWWLSLLEKHGVKYLMVVPNTGDRLLITDRERHDFQPTIEKHGYKLIAKEPKYSDPLVQRYAVHPGYHYLFELSEK